MIRTRLLEELCSVPTAPFAEGHVVRFVERFVAGRKKLALSRDRFGNLLVELRTPDAGKSVARWVFTAHMDHPGFVARSMRDRRTVEADFRGYVLPEYFSGAKVRFFNPDGSEVTARVKDFDVGDERPVPAAVRLTVSGEVVPGAPGMWDQGEGRLKGGRFYSRVCDDLAGAAGAMAMLDDLHRRPPKSPVAVLFTRAEEEGFIGAVGASRYPQLLRKSDRIVAIETSAMQLYAPQGKGAIIRVGDRTSVFNSALTYFLSQQAAALAKKDKTFRHQRALMPGGTCEATVYDVYGFIASSICVALGNYHNMDAVKQRIGPEYIDVDDWTSMVKLFIHLARTGHEFAPGHQAIKQRIEKRFEKLKQFL